MSQRRGVAKDSALALGRAVAQNNLALPYANGEGTARDDAEADAWLDLAADQPPAAAQPRDELAEELTSAQRDEAGAGRW